MLIELKVKNFAIIDSIHIVFKEGLNILSGETGAGKSVLLKSLGLLMGEKALSDTVRSGAESASIEGSFDLSVRPDVIDILTAFGIDVDEGELVVRRIISAQGKSRVYLNGHLSPLNHLRDIVAPLIEVTGQAAPLIEMTGQHENRNLQSKAYHLDLLDSYSGGWNERKKVSDIFSRLNEIASEVESIETEARMRAQKLDFLTFQREEIKELKLRPGEEQELENQVSRMKNSARLQEFVSDTESALYSADDSVLVRIYQVLQRAGELQRFDENLTKKLDPLAQAKTLIEEVVYEIRDYGRNLDTDEAGLLAAEEKLNQFRKLQKKYGGDVSTILNTLGQIEREIQALENSDETLKELRAEEKKLRKDVAALAENLHKKRIEAALLLSKGVNDELLDLNMKGLQFHIRVDKLEELTSSGFSDVEFMTRTSKQDSLRPLAKFASGGELSRILLSIKRVVGQSDQPRTYLFDEVDTGVSGLTAEMVGKKLRSIAKGQQVICVTHLPQVASFADCHFLIQKSQAKKGVQMEIIELDQDSQVQEIARLISGEKITKTSLEHARELLAQH